MKTLGQSFLSKSKISNRNKTEIEELPPRKISDLLEADSNLQTTHIIQEPPRKQRNPTMIEKFFRSINSVTPPKK
jgi:hypothetical protein